MAYLYGMSAQHPCHLFVYGSLRSGFHNPMYEYISRYFDFVGNGRVKGLLYDMGEYPGGVPTGENKYVVGEIYKIKDESEFSWAIGQLDDYEGVDAEAGEPALYRREITIAFYNDEEIPAWIYWYSGDITGRPVIASGDMMEYLNSK